MTCGQHGGARCAGCHRLQRRPARSAVPPLPDAWAIETLVNKGGAAEDRHRRTQTIRNDGYWKGFFPKGHVLNAMSSAIFTGFSKQFHKKDGKYTGITSDTDGRIRARNSLEEIVIGHGSKGTLEPGKYILLRYLDAPWQGFYDIFKIINDDLLIGRVYLGEYPNGARMFTFPMSRRLRLRPDDRATITRRCTRLAATPTPRNWRACGAWTPFPTRTIAGGIAYLQFNNKPDGRLEARYQLMGLMEGLVVPDFLQDHFQLNDFTPFHDEIRKVIGRFHGGQVPHGTAAGLADATGEFVARAVPRAVERASSASTTR